MNSYVDYKCNKLFKHNQKTQKLDNITYLINHKS